jgi:glycosyltransferase involved in cell wall biosynthesis
MAEPLISVIMNCYNSEKYLREAIDSVRAQTYRNWELVFWDNQSTDGSAAIVRGYDDPRIRYCRAPRHTKLGEARKLAVEASSGEFFAVLDCDDIFLPDNLATQLASIESANAAVSYAGFIVMDQTGRRLREYLPRFRTGNVFGDMLHHFDIGVPAMFFRRAALDREGLNFDEKIYGSEEYCLTMQLAVRNVFAVVHRPVAKVRLHRESLTYTVMDKWATDRVYTLDRIRAQHPGIEARAEYRKGFREAYARATYYRARWLVASDRRKEAIRELRGIALVDYRYLALFLVLSISRGFWNWVHSFLLSARNAGTSENGT